MNAFDIFIEGLYEVACFAIYIVIGFAIISAGVLLVKIVYQQLNHRYYKKQLSYRKQLSSAVCMLDKEYRRNRNLKRENKRLAQRAESAETEAEYYRKVCGNKLCEFEKVNGGKTSIFSAWQVISK